MRTTVSEDKPAATSEPVSTGERTASRRILELDAIRALTCLNLLLFHYTYVYANKYGFESDLGFTFPYGKYGVQLFFMLSGLVNALTLMKKRQPAQFLISRCVRIFPAYWLVIGLNVILLSTLSMYGQDLTWGGILANLTTLPNLLGHENLEPVTWTLQVEILFYLFLMIAFGFGWLERPLRTLMVSITICFVSCCFIDYYRQFYPGSKLGGLLHVGEELFLLRTLPLFGMGILLNEIKSGRGILWQNWLGICLCGIVFHLVDLRDHNPAATVLMMGLLTMAAFGKIPLLRFKPLVFISFISYPLYLFHNNLGSALIRQLESFHVAPLVTVVVATLFSIGVATGVTYGFEQPLTRRLLKRFQPRSKSPTSDTHSASSMNGAMDAGSQSITVPSVAAKSSQANSTDELDDVLQAENLVATVQEESSQLEAQKVETDQNRVPSKP